MYAAGIIMSLIPKEQLIKLLKLKRESIEGVVPFPFAENPGVGSQTVCPNLFKTGQLDIIDWLLTIFEAEDG